MWCCMPVCIKTLEYKSWSPKAVTNTSRYFRKTKEVNSVLKLTLRASGWCFHSFMTQTVFNDYFLPVGHYKFSRHQLGKLPWLLTCSAAAWSVEVLAFFSNWRSLSNSCWYDLRISSISSSAWALSERDFFFLSARFCNTEQNLSTGQTAPK